jgi:hypothetical protein
MRYSIPLFTSLAALALAVPASGQGGNINMGVWVTVGMADVAKFEEAAAEHSQWHARQNDTWAWPVYQAMSGRSPEYVFVTPNHSWGDFDAPVVDMNADGAHWAESGARYSTSETIRFWEGLPDLGSPPADPTAFPIIQVIEFSISPGGENAILHGAAKFKEATQGQGTYTWSRSASSDGPPTLSIALWYPNFAALGGGGPTPEEILTAAFGATEAGQLMEAFNEAATVTSSRIWVYRPDLSYIPN